MNAPVSRIPAGLPPVRRVVPGAALAVALVLPLVLQDLTFYVQTVLAAIVVTGLSLFMGYAGQASLGQAAFVAVGGLTVAALTVNLSVPPLIALGLAPVLAGLFAAAVGAPLLRLRGHYLAFGTLAVLFAVQAVMTRVEAFGGAGGILGIPPLEVGPFVVADQRPYAYLSLAALVLSVTVTYRLVHSRFGRGIRALAGSESAAASSGVPVLRSKVVVFAVAGAMAGLAGGIGAFFTPFVSPDSYPALLSFSYLIMAVVGGLGSVWGGTVGALVLGLLLQALSALSSAPGLPPTAGPVLQYAGYGLALGAFVLLRPQGIVAVSAGSASPPPADGAVSGAAPAGATPPGASAVRAAG